MAWTQTANIKGASGAPGASGATGPAGASGASGGTGAPGASGPAGTTTWSGITDKPAVIAAGVDAAAARNVISAEYTGNKGVANGYCGLDASGLVPSSSLPGFVDDVIEGANLAAFAATGAAGALYVALDTNKVYRWSGSTYVEISGSPGSTDAVPEGSTNLYYTAARADGRITAAVGSSVQAYSATLTTYAGKTAPTGAVVGTTDTQALTNKDLSGASNTFPAFIKRSIATVTTATTLGSTAGTDYVTFIGASTETDPYASDVKLFLQGEGTNNSTTFTDSSSSAKTMTRRGDAKISTDHFKYGSSSMYFDGNGDSVTAASSSDFDQTGNFTTEMWFRPTALGTFAVLSGQLYSGYLCLGISSASKLVIDVSFIGTGATGTTTISTNTWYHAALVKSGTTATMYLNGNAEGTYTTNGVVSGNLLSVASLYSNNGQWFTGYVDNFRHTKAARYTSNFVPDVSSPVITLPTAVGNTNQYTLKNISGVPANISTTSSQTVDGTSLTLTNGDVKRLVSDASNWRSV